MVSFQPDLEEELGPVDFLAVEFPGAHISAPGFEQLLGLAEQLDQLTRLGDLRQADVLTEAEFQAQKNRILNG